MKRFATLILTAAAAAAAHGSTISFSFTNGQSLTEINQSGNLGLFNSSLGTLTGATLSINGAGTFTFSGTNVAAQAQTANITSSTDLSFTSSLAALMPFISDDIILSHSSGSQTYAVGQTRSFGPFSESGSNVDNLAAILGSLQVGGGGAFSLGCHSLSGLLISGGGGNINTTQATQAGCSASIIYTYTAGTPTTDVPEPGSLALAGLALAGMVTTALRRKS